MKYRFDKAYLEITNACNLSCSFCGLTSRPQTFMGLESFTAALDRLQGYAPTLYFHLMGEPLLHPLLGTFLDLAGERGFSVNLTTNGTLLDSRLSDLTGKKALARLNLSVQSLEQYPESRRVERFDALIAGIKELVPAQRSARPNFLASFRFWTRDDGGFSEPLLDRLAEAFGSDSPNKQAGITRQILEGRNGYVLAPGIAVHAADSFEWPTLPTEGRPEGGEDAVDAQALKDGRIRGFCRGLRDQIGVLADSTVVPCCLDRNGDIALGNLFEAPLEEILRSDRARALYEGFTAHTVVEPLCARCTFRKRFFPG